MPAHVKTFFLLGFSFVAVLAGCAESRPPATVVRMTGAQLLQERRKADAPAVMVHIWATWCAPCVEELPAVIPIIKEYRGRGLRTFLISVDSPDDLGRVKQFLSTHKMDGKTYLADPVNQEFVSTLAADWSGAIPATFLYTSDGTLKTWWEGKRSRNAYTSAIEDLLKAKE